MKHLFTMTLKELPTRLIENIPEDSSVLLLGQPFSDDVKVFLEIGTLNKSEALATDIGQYVHGRRWGTITRNDGHYIEVETEDHEDSKGVPNAKERN